MKHITIFNQYLVRMKSTFHLIIPLCFVFVFSACSSTSGKLFNEKTYTLGGGTITVSKGDIIASEVNGEVKSKTSWGNSKLTYSNDYIEKKLYYLGYEEPYIHLMYREYKRGEPEPSVSQIAKTNPEQNPLTKLGKFNIKILSVEGQQASFLLLNQQAWNDEQQKFIFAKEKKPMMERKAKMEKKSKRGKLEQIIHATDSKRREAEAAKDYAGQFSDMTASFKSFSKATKKLNTLNSEFYATRKRNYSDDQLIKIYQTLKQKFAQSSQYFTLVASSLQAWDRMDNDFKIAAKSGIGKEYFTKALNLKDSGYRSLQAEQFSVATQKFTQARKEINSIITDFKNSK